MDEPVKLQTSIAKPFQNGIAPSSTLGFDRERTAIYDWQYEKLVPLRDALPLLRRFVLSNPSDNARILARK
jgi:hypothetical protein